ncbi:hypothetical protein LOTGIDRAFT_168336 [Lottia gigantea]|uniref:Uncharacterized protein n=1 Tax=Lottia gigantea TaxID=225164 RepID=V3ZKR6_LOTGI|nr:hypothetical protein LOTGIDRAFT_168336 [Lottia gigantea]ESO84847.1 hypothetical protein LOTGIDRAFT_168336 [Lottia gigantea]
MAGRTIYFGHNLNITLRQGEYSRQQKKVTVNFLIVKLFKRFMLKVCYVFGGNFAYSLFKGYYFNVFFKSNKQIPPACRKWCELLSSAVCLRLLDSSHLDENVQHVFAVFVFEECNEMIG